MKSVIATTGLATLAFAVQPKRTDTTSVDFANQLWNEMAKFDQPISPKVKKETEEEDDQDVAVYKRSFGPDQDVVVIVTGKDVDWINAVKNEMIQTLNFLTNFEQESIEDLDDEIDQVIVSKGEKKNFAEVE